MPFIPLINGRTFSWSDIEVRLLGNPRPLAGITEISWKSDNENDLHHGGGREAVSYSMGKKMYSGSMKLHLDEVAKIKKDLAVSDLGDLPPFDVVISYTAGAKITTETLVGVLITGEDHSSSAGGAVLEVNISFKFTQIVSR